MGMRQAANVFWSVASLRRKLPELQKLIPALLLKIKSSNKMVPQDVANIIWGCAALRLPSDQITDMLPSLAEACFLNADDFEPQLVSNIVWGCGLSWC